MLGTIEFDLGKASTISGIGVDSAKLLCTTVYKNEDPTSCVDHTGSVKAFSIEYSTGNTQDTGNWVPIPGAVGTSVSFDGLENSKDVTFNPQSARFWRLKIHSTYNGLPALGDVRFYGRETILHCQTRDTSTNECTKAMTVVSMLNSNNEMFEIRLDI